MTTEEVKRFVFVSVISADNDEFTEEEKQAILARYDNNRDLDQDWDYVLEPINDADIRNKIIDLLKR